MPAFSALEVALICFVLLAAVTDLASRKISNVLVLSGLLSALVLRLQAGADASLPAWLGGMLTGFFVLLPLYLMRGMAAGDVKLMAMVGSFTGPLLALQICFATFLIGGVMALLIVLVKRRLRDALHNMQFLLSHVLLRAIGIPVVPMALTPGSSVGGMPYGLAIALGTLLLLGWRHA
ncbi:MAG TPA: prepilin peptidase [Janthinobacterium sp.]|nr:prepilin peptidase [Janthinobacterium sp.]